MEYSEDFKNMVKAHQGKFIGYGNPNAKVLIIVPKIDDDRLAIYNNLKSATIIQYTIKGRFMSR